MSRLSLVASLPVVLSLAGVSVPALAQSEGIATETAKLDPNGPAQTSPLKGSSIFTIGTMFGVSTPFFTPATYVVRDNKVLRTNPNLNASDYVLPAVFVLPSIGLYARRWWTTYSGGPPGTDHQQEHAFTLSAIVPAGLTAGSSDGKNLSVGLGVACGWTVPSGAQVGLALAVIWQQAQSLDGDQQQSLQRDGVLATGASNTISTTLRPSAAIGLFLAPTF
jgi:hypothetical protein